MRSLALNADRDCDRLQLVPISSRLAIVDSLNIYLRNDVNPRN
ncbi:MAG: hypothetical protein ACM37W_15015 [Actinomycetota bacterium]